MHRNPSSHSGSTRSFARFFRPIISLDRIRSSLSLSLSLFFSLDDSVPNESYMLCPSQSLYIISWSENCSRIAFFPLSRPISTPNGGYAAGPPIWNLFRFIGDGVCSPNIWLPRDIFPRRSEKIRRMFHTG